MGLLDILQQYAGAASPPADQAHAHFDEVARQVPASDLGSGLAAAFRSDATPPFGQMVGQLFGNSNPQQQAGLLNQLVQSLGPAAIGSLGGGVLGRILGSSAGAAPTITPEQASQLSPADVGTVAAHAEKHDPGIVDRVGSFYAQHPTLVKTIGAVALSALMGHLNSRR